MPEMHEHHDLKPVAACLHRAIDAYPGTQRELARRVGFESPHFLSMLKHGETRLPMKWVIAVARELNIDPGYLLRLVLAQDLPDELGVIEEIFGLVVSANEQRIILALRKVVDDKDPGFEPEPLEGFLRALAAMGWLG